MNGASDGQTLPKKIQKLAALVSAVKKPGEPMTRIYVMVSSKGAPPDRAVTRAGGAPIGVSAETRPRYEDAFMQHLWTIDLDEAPELRRYEALKNARAVALFIGDAKHNEAFDEDTDETAVVAISEKDIAAHGVWKGAKVDDPKGRSLALYPVDVPTRALTSDLAADAYDRSKSKNRDERAFGELASALLSEDRVGGPVLSFNLDDYEGDLVAQFSEAIIDVNLGDAGTMYVFTDRAFWDCH